MSKYIQEGTRSYHENGVRYVNPYRPGSAEHNDFERGWFQALKRAPERERSSCNRGALGRRNLLVLKIAPRSRNEELPDDIYVTLASKAREDLMRSPSYKPKKYGWRTKVYYARFTVNKVHLWKIGVTSNDLNARFCRADRRRLVLLRQWEYADREEAEAIERAVLKEYAADIYEGSRVLQSGGDSELFTRDVLKLDWNEK
ncbi:MAG: hypothetical protein AB7Q81_05020 [Gammaproteobacteria bacterium]